MDIEEKTYTALIGGITVIEFEDFREAKNTCNGQEIMVSYIGDDDDIIATYQDLAKEYSISQPEFWQSTETDISPINTLNTACVPTICEDGVTSGGSPRSLRTLGTSSSTS